MKCQTMKCPKCGEMIDWLDCYQKGDLSWTVSFRGRLEYEEHEFLDDAEKKFYCPECCECVATGEERLMAFFNNKQMR